MSTAERLISALRSLSQLRSALVIAALGFVLVLPSLGLGLASLDDAPQRAFIVGKLHGDPALAARPWYDVYNLVSGERTRGVFERFVGARPWWAWPDLKVRFFRPLAAAALYLDYAVVGEAYWLAHLHSALWYFAACFGVALVCMRLSQHRVTAMLGAAIYAFDDAHASPASWLAGRNATIAVVFVACSLLLYDAAVSGKRRGLLLASVASLACALLSAENSVSAVPLFVAHALFLDPRPLGRRALSLGAMLATVLGWLTLHHALGFGTHGSGAYLNPISEFPTYWTELPMRCGELLHAQLAAPWNLAPFLPGVVLRAVELLQFWALLPVLLVFVIRAVDRDRELAFWSTAFMLGLLPLAAADPHERLLTHVGIAFSMLLAHVLVGLARAARRLQLPGRVLVTGFIAALLAVYLLLSPIALAMGCSPAHQAVAPEFSAPHLDRDPQLETRTLVLVNVPSLLTPLLIVTERFRLHRPVPDRIIALGASGHEVEVTRLDEHSFELFTAPGYLLDRFSHYWRGPSVPLHQGERIDIDAYALQVLRLTPDGRPLRVRFTFRKKLDDPSLHFVYWTGHELADFRFSAPKQRKIIPAEFDHSHQLPEELVR